MAARVPVLSYRAKVMPAYENTFDMLAYIWLKSFLCRQTEPWTIETICFRTLGIMGPPCKVLLPVRDTKYWPCRLLSFVDDGVLVLCSNTLNGNSFKVCVRSHLFAWAQALCVRVCAIDRIHHTETRFEWVFCVWVCACAWELFTSSFVYGVCACARPVVRCLLPISSKTQ